MLALGSKSCGLLQFYPCALEILGRRSGKTARVSKSLRLVKEASVGIAFSFLLLGYRRWYCLSPLECGGSAGLSEVIDCFIGTLRGHLWSIGGLKFHIGRKLDSPSLKKDGICSGAGAFISAGTALGGVMLLSGADSWWFDSTVAVLVCTFLFMYACWTLTRNAIKKDAVTGTWAPESSGLSNGGQAQKPRTKQDDDSTSFGIKMSARDGLQSGEVANPSLTYDLASI